MLTAEQEFPAQSQPLRILASQRAVATVLVAGSALSLLAGWRTFDMIRAEAEARFKSHADHLAAQIKSHVMQAEDGLLGLAALMRVVPRLSQEDFRTYVAGLDLQRQFPGIRGFGFVARQGPGDSLVVKFIEPLSTNQRALGMDIAADLVRREAAERAIATGKIALSAPVVLVQDATPGWLLYLPVPSGLDPSGTAKPQGLVYAPISAGEVLARITAQSDGDVDFRLFDAQAPAGAALYDSRLGSGTPTGRGFGSAAASPMFKAVRSVMVAGRTFHVHVDSTRQLESDAGRLRGALVALVGFFLTALLAQAMGRLRRRGEQAEANALEWERLIKLLTENVPARLSYWDREGRCRLLNRSLAVVFGRPPEEVIGKRLDELLPAAKWQLLSPRIQAALGGEPQRFEWSTISMNGGPGTALFYCIPDVQRGEVAGLLLASIDITELKEAQKEAQRASEAKSQFLSNMSHELRTPMNAVLGMLALLRNTPLGERQGDYVTKAEGAARSLLRLLDDILDVSRIEAGKMVLDPRPFFLQGLLDDLKVILTSTIGDKPVSLQLEADPDLPPWLVGDDMRLRQILINLGGNAVKFTRAGQVVVEIRQVGRKEERVLVEFSVADTGIGISPEDQQRIFSEFSQASAATTREFGGSGLGLAICSRLVALMGSELQVRSAVGQGSRFHFLLWMEPAQVAPMPVAAQSLAWIQGHPLRGHRLLLVEDNLINQQVAREVLSAAGADVQIAGNGREAVLAVAGGGPFDAVLMDLQMPVMDGFQATQEIRGKLFQTDLPIIALTANAMEGDRQRCRAAGMVDHVGKPFVPAELVRVLLKHLSGENAPSTELPADSQAQAQPRDTAPIVDRAAAVQRLGGDQALYHRLIPAFVSDLHKARASVPQLPRMERSEVTRMFHTLKSTAAAMGANQLSATAAAAESASKEEGADPAPDLLRTLVEQIEATLAEFRRDGAG